MAIHSFPNNFILPCTNINILCRWNLYIYVFQSCLIFESTKERKSIHQLWFNSILLNQAQKIMSELIIRYARQWHILKIDSKSIVYTHPCDAHCFDSFERYCSVCFISLCSKHTAGRNGCKIYNMLTFIFISL